MIKKYKILIFIIFTLFFGCDDFKEESFSMSEIDQRACQQLNADSLALENVAVGLDTSFVTMTDSIEYLKSLDSSMISISSDPWSVRISRDTCFLSLNGSGETLIVINESVDLSLFSENGINLPPESHIIELSTVSECLEMKSRYIFDLTSGDYLMRITGGKLIKTLFVIMSNE
jgi:hypothetical protein